MFFFKYFTALIQSKNTKKSLFKEVIKFYYIHRLCFEEYYHNLPTHIIHILMMFKMKKNRKVRVNLKAFFWFGMGDKWRAILLLLSK